MISYVGVEESQNWAKTAAKSVPKGIPEIMEQFLEENFHQIEEDQEFMAYTQTQGFIESLFFSGNMDPSQFSKPEIMRCVGYFQCLLSLKEKKALVEVIKSQEMRGVIKTLVSVLKDLLEDLYSLNSLPTVLLLLLLLFSSSFIFFLIFK